MNAFQIIISVFAFVLSCGILVVLYKKRDEYFGSKNPIVLDEDSGLPLALSVSDLGTLEGNIERLDEVIIVAHTIERPEGNLYNSVWKNFSREVKYTFLISQSQFKTEKNGFIKIFEALANVARQRTSESPDLKDVLCIKSLTFDWNDFPYIFYRLKASEKNTKSFMTFAYQGNQVKEGIANDYLLIKPSLAHTISRAVVAATKDETLNITLDEFENKIEDDNNIIQLYKESNGKKPKAANV